MAITLEANYSKKLGLPGYSSHQYMITLRTELADLSQVEAESTRLYALLQTSVDRELQNPGFVPEPAKSNGNCNGNGQQKNGTNDSDWACSPKQRELILKITEEHKLDKNQVESLSQERFGKGVRQLNKLEASGLIEELFEQTGQARGNGRSRFQGRYQRAGAR